MKDLTIVSVGIRNERWPELVRSIATGIKKYSYEIILVGPRQLPQELHHVEGVRYIKEDSRPTRKYMCAASIAEGKYIGYIGDDSIITEGSIDRAVDILENGNKIDLVALRHIQTNNYDGIVPAFSQVNPEWWTVKVQQTLKKQFVREDWKVTCDPLINLDYLKQLGGLDCRFHFLNFAVHDLTFRAQKNGSLAFISPDIVMNTPIHEHSHHNAIRNLVHEDEVLFDRLWSKERHPVISWDNWKEASQLWDRYRTNFQCTKLL